MISPTSFIRGFHEHGQHSAKAFSSNETHRGLGASLLGGLLCMGFCMPAAAVDEVVVVGTTPVPGMTVNVDKVPGNVQTLKAGDLSSLDGTPSLIDGLSSHLGSVSINDTLADAFQPDILYRGFEASPVLGTPQGLAVYQNGVRINEAFGDTVNWDLFPDIAIDRVDIVSANPLFGLNALGGAVSVTMKNGFSYHGLDGELSGGSFDQRQGAAEFGTNNDVFGFYAAARLLDQTGWRLFSHDSVRQYYADLSFHENGASIDLSFTHADNQLFGPGAAPVQSLAISSGECIHRPAKQLQHVELHHSERGAEIHRHAWRHKACSTPATIGRRSPTAIVPITPRAATSARLCARATG